jgi:hypothetical protein
MLFKNVNYFFQMVDAFDAILNDTVDLYVQAVDHHRKLAGVGIRQRQVTVVRFLATFVEFQSPSPEFGQPRFWQSEWSDFGLLARI